MSIIKEPEGIIFSVESRELTPEEKKLLAEFISIQRKKNKLLRRRLDNKKFSSAKRKLNKVIFDKN